MDHRIFVLANGPNPYFPVPRGLLKPFPSSPSLLDRILSQFKSADPPVLISSFPELQSVPGAVTVNPGETQSPAQTLLASASLWPSTSILVLMMDVFYHDSEVYALANHDPSRITFWDTYLRVNLAMHIPSSLYQQFTDTLKSNPPRPYVTALRHDKVPHRVLLLQHSLSIDAPHHLASLKTVSAAAPQ